MSRTISYNDSMLALSAMRRAADWAEMHHYNPDETLDQYIAYHLDAPQPVPDDTDRFWIASDEAEHWTRMFRLALAAYEREDEYTQTWHLHHDAKRQAREEIAS